MSAKERAMEYAKNFPLVSGDGLFGPVPISNVTDYNDRVIINLCLKTRKTSPRNASISYPKEWNKAGRFKAGDLVNAQITDGYIRKIWPAKVVAPIAGRITDESASVVNADAVRETVSDSPKPY